MATFPCPQAQNSSTFTPPPLDGSLTLPEIYDHHLHKSSNHPLFVYDNDAGVQAITWGRVGVAIHTAARRLSSLVTPRETDETPVVAILSVIAGIMRAGYRAFPISPRNSERGIANLLLKMKVEYIIVSKDDAMQRVANGACELVRQEQQSLDVTLLDAPSFQDLFSDPLRSFEPLPPMQRTNVDSIALILHSSGSTSFPKPIPLTHRNLIQWGTQPYYGETDLCGRILSNHSLPFFHAMGVVSLTWATTTGVTLSNFAPRDPPTVVTPEGLFKSAVTCQSRLIFCVPTFLEEWSQSQEKIVELQKYEAIMFGGAPIQKAVGDMLSNLGVKLYPFYGATELGGTSKFLPKNPPPEGWEYFKISSHSNPVFVEHDKEADVYQLLIKSTASHTPAVTNTMSENVKAYDTNDLVIRHPTNPTLMKIFGRADDQIMHSTGEKTNPVPMETIINRHPMIQSCVIFGRGRFQAGVLVEPKPEYAIDPNDREKLASFRNAIWPSVESANDFGPSHSRIFKEIILVAHPSKPFLYTPKGTPRRQVIINQYEEEIEQGYIDLETASVIDLGSPDSFGLEECRLYVLQLVEQIMGRELREDDDFFLSGCDSLKATWIRNNLLNILRSINIDTEAIPINFIYLYPTISRLSQYLSDVANGNQSDPTQETMRRMNELVEKYSADFKQHVPIHDKSPGREIVLLTGSTGGLGSYVLEYLINDDGVSRIYCLNRKGKKGSLERQEMAFKDRDIDITLLGSEKVVFVEGDASETCLGLTRELYEEIRSSITSVLHIGKSRLFWCCTKSNSPPFVTAWRVDFNISISSTEPLLAGTRALTDLCLSSPQKVPPRLVFASSIGVVRNWKDGMAPEIALPDATVAVGSGYPESKWVAEQILDRASQQTSFNPVIVRIGQLSGGRNGFWNPYEWVPSVIQTAHPLQCLPDTPGGVSWIPVHLAAKAFADMRSSPTSFLHLVHPNPATWSDVFKLVSRSLDVPLVPYSKWLDALEESAQTPNQVPPSSLQLLDFYRSANKPLSSQDDEAFGFPRLSTKQAELAVPALSSLDQLGLEDVTSWLSYWGSTGVLTSRV
ncbi:hypothetical protein D9756_007248 [Leucocoprinus leucothites]|uniref:Acetyl-CoA synthetase-like protein n=1 Tax=Leucocoprinus leucothites TaxID=201217 RepID=A0A8H5D626_9AGAR|nr:hypothetical protein D9756_007248 [Leucoagaricus leucothites]